MGIEKGAGMLLFLQEFQQSSISSFFQKFKAFWEFGLFFQSSAELMKSVSSMFHNHCLGTGYAINFQVVRKNNVLCIIYFTYSLILILVLMLVLVFSFIFY